MFYDRKIKYLDYYENAQRVRGCGFIKIEVRSDCLQIDLSVTGLYPTDAFERDILLCGEKKESGIGKTKERVVGKIMINGGKGQFRQLWRDIDNIGNSGISYEEWKGIRIPLGTNREISSSWERQAVESGRRREMAADEISAAEIPAGKKAKGWIAAENAVAERVSAGRAAAGGINTEDRIVRGMNTGNSIAESMNAGNLTAQKVFSGEMAAEKIPVDRIRSNWETAGKIAAEKITTEKMAAEKRNTEGERLERKAEEGFQSVKTTSEEGQRQLGEKSGDVPGADSYAGDERYNSRTAHRNEGNGADTQNRQETGRGNGSRKESINDRGAENEKPVRLLEDKWQQIYAIYPHIHPFHDAREYISIRPADFVLFPAESYKMVNNSFLLHGYYNYRHLLLAKVERKGEVRYYIGVPGNFYEKEKQVAIMFGFESFECAEEPAQAGDFGYYMMRTEL